MIDLPDLHPPSARRRGIMLAQYFDERRFAKWGNRALIQPKLDGERCRAVINEDGKCILLSSEENIITSAPHIVESIERLHLRGLELDGELYSHGMEFGDIHSRVSRKVNDHADAKSIELHVFDLVLPLPQLTRQKLLEGSEALAEAKYLHVVKAEMVEGVEAAFSHLQQYEHDGYEGIILRHPDAVYERKRSLWIMKWKGKREDIYEIVGSVEEFSLDGRPKGRLGALVCRGDDLGTFRVGSGLSDELRSQLWDRRDELPGQFVRVKYQSINPDSGSPRFGIFAGLYKPGDD